MRRALASAAVALVLTGSAQAASFVPTDPLIPAPATQTTLPSASLPNAGGSLSLPDAWTEHARGQQQVSYDQLLGLWQGAAAAYRIPWQVLAAINKVESNFGRNMGPSSAGAVGWMQFMPSTWLRWGWDFDGDGFADPWSARDGIYSAARYLAAAGGATDIAGAVYSYNHAQWYVNEVLSLAQVFGSDEALTFQLDSLQLSLQRAGKRLAGASEQLVSAQSRAGALRSLERALLRRAERAKLLSDRGPLQLRAAQVASAAGVVEGRLEGLRQAVDRARAALASARKRSLSVSFNPVTAPLLANPSYASGGYVFPVGGGATTVSVAQTHHDYPAADIAAPSGSPVYALANAQVLNAWSGIDPACGIGLTMRTDDGRAWTYCHLSYREPFVKVGARLPAGVEIGLVGATGDATGPHLHLQLQPASSYPQEEQWFRSFEGLAYQWNDSSPLVLPPTTGQHVFALVTGGSRVLSAGESSFFGGPSAGAAPSQTIVPRTVPRGDGATSLARSDRWSIFAGSATTDEMSEPAPSAGKGVVEFTR